MAVSIHCKERLSSMPPSSRFIVPNTYKNVISKLWNLPTDLVIVMSLVAVVARRSRQHDQAERYLMSEARDEGVSLVQSLQKVLLPQAPSHIWLLALWPRRQIPHIYEGMLAVQVSRGHSKPSPWVATPQSQPLTRCSRL